VHENYHRPTKLKEIIFDLNQNEYEKINLSEVLKIFTLKALGLDTEKWKNKTYYEVLFN
jgi:hypothetical protein